MQREEPQREEKPRWWGEQTVGDSRKKFDIWEELCARAPFKIEVYPRRNNLFGGKRRNNTLILRGREIRIQ